MLGNKYTLSLLGARAAQLPPSIERALVDWGWHKRDDYVAATTYHDGKWLGLVVDSDEVLADVKRLLAIKRKPKRA